MGRYAIPFVKGADNVTQLVELLADATRPRRQKWYDVAFGCSGTPADAAFIYLVNRMTASGTGSAVTPKPLDPADAATEADAEDTCTADGTFTAGAVLLEKTINQRSAYRWFAVPGSELVMPATASNGAGVKLSTASTLTFAGTVYSEEQ